MTPKQEIEQLLHEFAIAPGDFSMWNKRARILAILDSHEIVPIDEIGLRRECLALIEEADRRAKNNGMGDVAYRNAIQRLKLFMRDGKTK